MSMAREPERRVFSIFSETVTFLLLTLQTVCAYGLAAILVSNVAQCAHLFSSVVVAGPGVSSGLASFFLSRGFLMLVLRANTTQIATTMFVSGFATLYLHEGLFRASAMAVLARLRKPTVPTFFKAVAVVTGYSAVFWAAFRLLDAPAQIDLTLMLPGGAVYLAGTVAVAAVCQCRLACAAPALEDAGVSHMRRGLALIHAPEFFAAAAVFALSGGILVAVAVLTAFPSQVLPSGTVAMNAVLCMVVALTLVAQPVLPNTNPACLTRFLYVRARVSHSVQLLIELISCRP